MNISQFIQIPTGVSLECAVQGEPSGVPLLLLHGVTDSWRSFESVMPHLPASMRVFALSQRGHGESSRPAAGYRYSDFAADVQAFMDVFDIDSAIIVGHSMGRAIAQRFAIDHPERTRGLVLIGAFAGDAGNPVIAEVEAEVSSLKEPIDPNFVREFQVSTLAQPVSPAFVDMVVQESLKVPVWVWQAVFKALLEDDVAASLGTIAVPTLIISGDRDGFASPNDVEAQAAAITGARLMIYERAGHGVHWEEPARFGSDLAAFAAELGT